jgi:hypothetical protein
LQILSLQRMRAEFVGPFGRHGHNLPIIERLRNVLFVYNVHENRESRSILDAVYNPFLECKKLES